MLNNITIMGRLTRDPELRVTGSGISVANFTVAVDRDFGNKESGEKETDFIDCSAWRKTAEFVAKHFTKGRMIVVRGSLQINNYTDKDGNKRRNAVVVADNCYFGDSKKDMENGNTGSRMPAGNSYSDTLPYSQQPAANSQNFQYPFPGKQAAGDFGLLDGDDSQLPF